MHKVIHCEKIPEYMSENVEKRSESRHNVLRVKSWNQKVAKSGIQFAGPSLWNSLPNDLKDQPNPVIFKKQLKSYLYKDWK